MDKREDAKLYMYDTTITGCDEDNTIPPIVPAFDAQLTAFKSKVDEIHDKAVERDKDITGNTAAKKTTKQNCSKIFAGVADSVASYAASAGNEELKAEMKWTEAKLNRVKDEDFDSALKLIRDRANDNLAALVPYNVDAATITQLNGLRTIWNTVKAKPQSSKGTRKALDIAITQLFKDCDGLLKDQLDKSIAPFRTTHPDFYNTYFANRNIIDNPVSPTQFSGKVVIKGTTTGLPLVQVEVEGTSFKVVTDINGNYALKCPQPGIKNVKASAAGYAPVTISNQLLKLGQNTEVNIEMEAV